MLRRVRLARAKDHEDLPLKPNDPEDFPLEPDDPEDFPLEPDDPEDFPLEPDDPEDFPLEPDDPEDFPLEPDDPLGENSCSQRHRTALRSAQRGRSLVANKAEETGVPIPEQRYSGDIIVRLSPLISNIVATTLDELASTLKLPDLEELLTRFCATKKSSRAITTPNAGSPELEPTGDCNPWGPTTLNDLEHRASSSDFPPRHSLWSYWRINARDLRVTTKDGGEVVPENGFLYTQAEIASRLVEELNALSEVDLAYREFEASDPGGPNSAGAPSAEELSDFQLYLDKAPLGIDASWTRAWLKDGDEGIALADLEQGWIRGHEDVDIPEPVFGDNRDDQPNYKGNHGTAVVSQLVAKPGNTLGVIGMAAGAVTLSVSSHFRKELNAGVGTNGHVADAITALTTGDKPILGPGDILLLEVQRAGQPTEVDPLDFDAIRTAAAKGVIVVEAAGNGHLNLDRLETADGRSMRRRSANFRDSGAIMVGAARSSPPHNRSWFSNYGSRVDCFGWGDSVVAAGYGDFLSGLDTTSYTDTFSGTSSAAPMIAGAAAIVQSLYRQNAAESTHAETWKRLSPTQMRALLSEPRTGTRQGKGRRGRIGVMPNLHLIVDRVLGIVPRVYLRDHVGDDGQRLSQRTYCSPDIIVTKMAGRNDLEREFTGEGRFVNQDVFDAELTSSTPSNVCVRVCNRGLRPAMNAKAKIYAAPVCTLVTPDRWRDLAADDAPLVVGEVPQGNTLRLSKSIRDVKSEHKCLVAVVEYDASDEGPVPCHPLNFQWGRYLRTMRWQNNVAVRNVYGIDVAGRSELKLDFLINGTPDAPRLFEFEVIRSLPEEVRVNLTTRLAIALKFARGRLWNITRDVSNDSAILHLNKQPRLPLGSTPLPANMDFDSCFALSAADKIQPGHSLAIRQLYRGEEVGRITWRFRAAPG